MRLLDALLGSLRGCLDGFPDKRRGINTTYSMGDIGMAAFSVFFMQSPSFLAHQRRLEQGHGRSNCASLFGIIKIPSDNHIRDMLDPADPALLHPVFAETIEQLKQVDGGLETVPPARRPRADRARRLPVSLLAEDPLRKLFDPNQKQRRHGILSWHAGGDIGGTRPR